MGNEMLRDRMLDAVGEAVLRLRPHHTLRVCVDGPDAAGKTTFADDLAARLEAAASETNRDAARPDAARPDAARPDAARPDAARPDAARPDAAWPDAAWPDAARPDAARPVIRLSIDRFHRPESERRRRGSLSPEGYYHDSFDYETVREKVLRPLGPGGDGRYLPGLFDYRAGSAARDPVRQAAPGSILLFDGVFMLRPELRGFWDLSVYLHADPEVSLRRALVRDVDVFGSVEETERRYLQRYLPGQALYRAEADPREAADFVIDMNDPQQPRRL